MDILEMFLLPNPPGREVCLKHLWEGTNFSSLPAGNFSQDHFIADPLVFPAATGRVPSLDEDRS